jgi:hypothetical protein
LRPLYRTLVAALGAYRIFISLEAWIASLPLATFLVIGRFYHAGRHKLLTYRWLAWAMKCAELARAFYEDIRNASLGWLHSVKDTFIP